MTPSHLRTHGITFKEYRERWPNAPLSSGYHKKNTLLGRNGVDLKPQIDGFEPEDFVVCRVCGKRFKQIEYRHLTMHGTTHEEYKKDYPNAPIICEDVTQRKVKAYRETCANRTPEEEARISKICSDTMHRWYNSLTPEKKREWLRKRRDTLDSASPEEKERRRLDNSRRNIERWANISQEERDWISDSCSRGQLKRWSKITKEERKILRSKWQDSLTEEEWEQINKNRSDGQKKRWANFTEEEKRIEYNKKLGSVRRKPNRAEQLLSEILSDLGFKYNRKMWKGRAFIPDFVHVNHPLVIEYDGMGGHDANVLRALSGGELIITQEEIDQRDNDRDDFYRSLGYHVLRIFPEDLKEGRLLIRNKVTEWMNQLGYTHCEPFDVGDWFE